jgi:hypothetical protein
MFAVPRLSKQLEQEWADQLAALFSCTAEDIRANATRFLKYPPGTLRLELMDNSVLEFQYAFHLVNEREKAIAIFTEHCGHHVYPFHEAKIFRGGELVFNQKHV